ncbi:tRNA (adenosine(37)-N6)-dimethylallyltransferase MiaA [Treponema phagedenis]|uniref:tRNA dimethylallyltransferase n=1 Tax=Treponema phagedenis TaxID=162 RepID=A0A0B7GWK4_TREPH|nr:tRNA (adenosine(37)-N6)-dimethylallyltransferase MiaA [Treponema phagedenis]NVP23318.1 tRNA (adenosine(37)-N6)-dimethylallyltransferase MiaA [Treponema phagedenis]QEJ95534.1 tRNA (adenosine(37)-N6)-dimethylallyltransferase MiaA [Treponema phagedenis]QEJ98429.1 tRNA (adenosine(37)-N6)-dimethylallyltransferase MiaA [Treponema phagedenis]QEK01389.1 tRNA (adenosine(37)-N6)-dimethylallyltransferase MiaA [Treponema phagedenis]QEK03937.1 tRNA (adenosine(37)-N6)-dimethylallyltransferase MiaA [Trepo
MKYNVSFSRNEHNMAVVLGATATGKTAFAVELAHSYDGEIISADSRQVYRNLNLGTGKDLHEYGTLPYHLIDICKLDEEYNVFQFQKAVYRLIPEIEKRGKLPIVCGGTGLYLDALLRNYELIPVPINEALRESLHDTSMDDLRTMLFSLKSKEAIHNKTDLEQRDRLLRAIEIASFYKESPNARAAAEKERPHMQPKVYGIRFERSALRKRIYTRLVNRIEAGMIEEVEAIHQNGYSWEKLESLGLEYRFTAEYLQNKIPSKEAYIDTLFRAICQFAKRQETWFRRMEKNGVHIHWLEGIS